MNNSAAKSQKSLREVEPGKVHLGQKQHHTRSVVKQHLQVGEIFTEAGAAFNKLAEMTMMLHPMADQQSSSQPKTPVKRKVVDEKTPTPSNNSGQVTLNMLNAPETEMDVGGLGTDVKLEFESATEEVAS